MITAIIPVYNTPPHHLLESVYSLINQKGVEPFEIIIGDDGSTNEKTKDSIDLLLKSSLRVRLFETEFNNGTPSILNDLHTRVTTPYILIQGSDDISDPYRVAKQLAYLKAHPKTDVLGTGLFMFRDGDITRKSIGTAVHKEAPTPKDRPNNPNWLVNHGTVIYRKSAVDAVGGYNPQYKRGQDVELWGRMLANKAVFRNLTEILYAWRRK